MKTLTTRRLTPINDRELDQLLSELRISVTTKNALEAQMEAEIKKIERRYHKRLRQANRQVLEEASIAFEYLETHRDRLIREAGKKTIEFLSGLVSWFKSKASLEVINEAQAVKLLERLGLPEMIKVEKSVIKNDVKNFLARAEQEGGEKAKKAKKILGRWMRLVEEEGLTIKFGEDGKSKKIKRADLPRLKHVA